MKYSHAADKNKEPILEVLKKYIISGKSRLLEIGSGSGQHATFLAPNFPNLHWVTSETEDHIQDLKEVLFNAKIQNIHGPELLKIGVDDMPRGGFDYLFTANTLHIMGWKENKALFKLMGKRLREGSLFIVYGPFNVDGEFTSESNEKFDTFLKKRDIKSGIRNVQDIEANMTKFGFKLIGDHDMPANNKVLVFERLEFLN